MKGMIRIKEIQINPNKKVLTLSLAAFVLITTVVLFIVLSDNTTYKKVSGLGMYDANTFVANSDYVFIGTVKEVGEAEHLATQPADMPYTKCVVKVEKNLKGNLVDEIILYKIGGIDPETNKKVVIKYDETEDVFPESGKKYIFITSCELDGTIIAPFDGSIPYSSKVQKKVTDIIKSDISFVRERYVSPYEK